MWKRAKGSFFETPKVASKCELQTGVSRCDPSFLWLYRFWRLEHYNADSAEISQRFEDEWVMEPMSPFLNLQLFAFRTSPWTRALGQCACGLRRTGTWGTFAWVDRMMMNDVLILILVCRGRGFCACKLGVTKSLQKQPFHCMRMKVKS